MRLSELKELKKEGKERTQEYFNLMQEARIWSELVIDVERAKERSKR